MKKLEIITKLLPFGSIILVLFSSIKLVTYYKIFNIPIVDFIEFSEFLTLFIDDMLSYLTYFGIAIILYLVDSNFENDEGVETQKIDSQNLKKIITIILAIIVLVFLALALVYSNSNSEIVTITSTCINFLLCLAYVFCSTIKFNFTYPFFLIVAILNYVIKDGLFDAYNLIENKDKINYVIFYDDKIIQTTDTIKYIGKTEKYIFIYDIEKKAARILPTENLKEINVIKNENQKNLPQSSRSIQPITTKKSNNN